MRKSFKLGFAYSFSTAENFFIEALGRRFDVTRDDKNPDYLIYGDMNPHQSFYADVHYNWSQYTNPNMVTISYSGENVPPPLDRANFCMGYTPINSPRHYHLPLYVIDMWGAVIEGWTDDYYQLVGLSHDYEKEYDSRKFCSFVVSNPRQEMRNRAFYFVNEYKRVDSAGPHLNNMGQVLPREKLHYKLDFLNEYRFNICFENGSAPGYVTEKLFNALQVKTMPIYWGSPTVGRDFNTRAFINASDHGDFNKLVDYVRHLDSPAGKQEYLDIISQPAFKNDIPNCYTSMEELCTWWEQNVMGVK